MNCSATRSPSARAVSASCWIWPVTASPGRAPAGQARRRPGTRSAAPRRRDHDLLVKVEQVLDHHHRVVSLLDGLPVEVRGELRQRLRVVVDGDRDVLLGRAELVGDLLVQRVGELRHRGDSNPARAIGSSVVRRDRRPDAGRRRFRRSSVGGRSRVDVRVRRAELDLARLRLLRLRHPDLEHAVRVRGADLRLVDPGRQADTAPKLPWRRSNRKKRSPLFSFVSFTRSPDTLSVSSCTSIWIWSSVIPGRSKA